VPQRHNSGSGRYSQPERPEALPAFSTERQPHVDWMSSSGWISLPGRGV